MLTFVSSKNTKMELQNSTILITGGTSGFGLEFAKQLTALGSTVIITGRNQQKLDDTKRLLPKVHTIQSDVSDPRAIAALYEQVVREHPSVSILINNAGEMRKLDLLDPAVDQNDVNREIAINLSGPVRMVQEFLPHLRTKKSAAIMNVTSGLAFVPFPLSPIYSATKSGLRAYTRALRTQLKPTGIKVFELLAPAADTPLGDKFGDDMDKSMLMAPDKLVAEAIKGLQKDKLEILPGMAGIMKALTRIAPWILDGQMVKVSEKVLGEMRAQQVI